MKKEFNHSTLDIVKQFTLLGKTAWNKLNEFSENFRRGGWVISDPKKIVAFFFFFFGNVPNTYLPTYSILLKNTTLEHSERLATLVTHVIRVMSQQKIFVKFSDFQKKIQIFLKFSDFLEIL